MKTVKLLTLLAALSALSGCYVSDELTIKDGKITGLKRRAFLHSLTISELGISVRTNGFSEIKVKNYKGGGDPQIIEAAAKGAVEGAGAFLKP